MRRERSLLRQGDEPVEVINHIRIRLHKTRRVVTRAAQFARFIGEITPREKPPRPERDRIRRTRREDDAFAKRVPVFQRTRDHEKAAARPAKVARDANKSAAPNGQRNIDEPPGGEPQHTIKRRASEDFGAVAIAPRERCRAVDLRWREQAAIMHRIEMLAVERVRGIYKPRAIRDVGKQPARDVVLRLGIEEKRQRKKRRASVEEEDEPVSLLGGTRSALLDPSIGSALAGIIAGRAATLDVAAGFFNSIPFSASGNWNAYIVSVRCGEARWPNPPQIDPTNPFTTADCR